MRTPILLLLFGGLALSATAPAQNAPPASAQANAVAPTGPADPLTEAVQALAGNQVLEAAGQKSATLTTKRLVLRDRQCLRALNLLRAWLNGETRTPPANLTDPSGAGKPERLALLHGLRDVSRLLAVEQYVLLADGQIGKAIDNTRDALRLTDALQTSDLIVWMGGLTQELNAVRPLVQHLGQLSERDAKLLLGLAQEWEAAPNPLPALLDGERARQHLSPRVRKVVSERDLGEAKDLLLRMDARTDVVFDRIKTDVNRPLWEPLNPARILPQDKAPDTDALDKSLASWLKLYDTLRERRGLHTAATRMLGCLAAIRLYIWEHSGPPSSLDVLKLGELAVDPFSGQPFVYKIKGSEYTLASVGATDYSRDEADEGQNAPGTPASRKAFSLLSLESL